MAKNVFLYTLGCEKNEADSAGMRSMLQQAGNELVADLDQADVAVINTCGFIGPAVEESVGAIVDACDAKNRGEIERVVVVGCLVSRSYQELKQELPEVDVYLGTAAYHSVAHAVSQKTIDAPEMQHYLFVPDEFQPQASSFAWMKIGDGCSRACSFCTIPSFKGRQKSKSVDAVLDELSRYADAGVQEVILVSQDSTQYGMDLDPRSSLPALLEAIDRHENTPPWMRVHYTFPGAVVKQVAPILVQSEKFCSYLDMPIQHTDPRVLKAMNRPTDRSEILDFLLELRAEYKDLALRTTAIVGHPGETDATVDRLAEDLEAIQFDSMSFFPWSPEEGTASCSEETQQEYDPEQIAAWLSDLSSLQMDIQEARLSQRVGSSIEVVIDELHEQQNHGDHLWQAHARFQSPRVDGITLVRDPKGELQAGQIVTVDVQEQIGPDLYADVAFGNSLGGIPIFRS